MRFELSLFLRNKQIILYNSMLQIMPRFRFYTRVADSSVIMPPSPLLQAFRNAAW